MFSHPPDISQAGFLALLDRIIENFSENPPYLGGTLPCEALPGEPAPRILFAPRLAVQVDGLQTWAISVGGKRVDVELKPGQCLFLAPNAWAIEFAPAPSQTFGILLESHRVRLAQIQPADRLLPIPGSPWAYHTSLPLSGAGVLTAGALSVLAEAGNRADGARELTIALLRLVRRHLEDDAPSLRLHGRAQATWREVTSYLEQNFADPVTRKRVAASLDVHPNYLSALARQMTGGSFQKTLEGIRMRHASRLLCETKLKLDSIATLCGYANSRGLTKAFHRAFGSSPGRFRALGARAKEQGRGEGNSE